MPTTAALGHPERPSVPAGTRNHALARMFCDECDVGWRGPSDSTCWVCEAPGQMGHLTVSGGRSS